MADAQVLYAEDVSGTTANSTTWVDTASISAASFTAGAKYLILANCIAKINSAADDLRVQLVHGTTPTVFDDASLSHENRGAAQEHEVQYMFQYTQPGTTELVKLQISTNASSTVTNILSQIIAINLDDVGVSGTDYFWAEDLTNYTMTGTPTAKATTASFTPNGTDRWLFIGHMIYDVVGITTQIGFELNDSVAGILNSAKEEGEDGTNDFLGFNLYWAGVPSNAARTVAVRPFDSGSAVMLASRVIAINLSKFAQSASVFDATEVDPATSPTFTTVATLAPTPTNTGNWVVIAFLNQDVNETTTDWETRLQINPSGGGLADDPPYTNTPPGNDNWDAQDEPHHSVFNLVSLISGASRTINFDVRQVAGTLGRVEDNGLVAFSVALAAAGTQYNQSVSGGITPSGTLSRQTNKTLAGSFSASAIAGALLKQASKILSGGMTPAGSITKLTNKSFSGSLTSSGAVTAVRIILKSIEGTLTSNGDLLKLTNKLFGGTLTGSGALTRSTGKLLSGIVSSTGVVSRLISKSFSGTLTSSGALTNIRMFLKSLNGTLTSSGTLTRQANKTTSGALSGGGIVSRLTGKLLSGTLTSSGILQTIRTFLKNLNGTLTSFGGLSRQTLKSFSGSLSGNGLLSRLTSRLLGGNLTGAGALNRVTNKSASGAMASTGTMSRLTQKILSGVVSALAGVLTAIKISGGAIAQAVRIFRIRRSATHVTEEKKLNRTQRNESDEL